MNLDNQKPFIWVKKYEEEGIKVDEKKVKEIEEENRRRAEENRLELLKIEERRRKRDLEYQQKLSDGEFLARQKEAEQHEHWEQQEEGFILHQERHRSKIRIRDGRGKPIDFFVHYIDVFGMKTEDRGNLKEEVELTDLPELTNPCEWFNGLKLLDLEALESDISIYMNADCEENQQYWKDLLEITRNEYSKLKELTESKSSDINTAILPAVISLVEGKAISELDVLEDEMLDSLRSDDPSVDVPFYKSALSRLRAYRANLRLSSNHEKNLEQNKGKILGDNSKGEREAQDFGQDKAAEEHDEQEDTYEKLREACIKDYEAGGYSPSKVHLDPKITCFDYNSEYELLVLHRNQVSNASSLDEAKMVTMTSEERAFMDAASKGMNAQEESTFSCEAAVRGQDNRALTYSWSDKYQPRKPRYFNRVHTGFEWNKYNQTHYDIDNPPPKVVQGYKFNIFYPDLIDKSKAPTFTLTPCKDDKDFCIIRFSSGPPYEDIAFRIVNREWNNSYKSGYRCQFINNMLQLWFQFKRYRYRR